MRWLTILVLGCSSPEAPPVDASPDTTPIDTGVDSGVDTGFDAGCDAMAQPGVTQLVNSPTVTGGIAVDSTHAYWTGTEAALIVGRRAFDRCDMAYDTVTSIPGNGEEALSEIFVDGKDLFWKRNGTGASSVMKCTLPMCAPQTIAPASMGPLAIDATRLYWTKTDFNGDFVMTCLKSNCAPAILAKSRALWIASDGTDVYWSTADTIFRCAASGCAMMPTTVTSATDASFLQVQAGNLFWLEAQQLVKCSTQNCTKTTLAPASNALVVDSTNAYVFAMGGIAKCALQGCGNTPMVIVPNVTPSHLTLDGTSVYWSTFAGLFRSTPK